MWGWAHTCVRLSSLRESSLSTLTAIKHRAPLLSAFSQLNWTLTFRILVGSVRCLPSEHCVVSEIWNNWTALSRWKPLGMRNKAKTKHFLRYPLESTPLTMHVKTWVYFVSLQPCTKVISITTSNKYGNYTAKKPMSSHSLFAVYSLEAECRFSVSCYIKPKYVEFHSLSSIICPTTSMNMNFGSTIYKLFLKI